LALIAQTTTLTPVGSKRVAQNIDQNETPAEAPFFLSEIRLTEFKNVNES
jgi:hypothetical protein